MTLNLAAAPLALRSTFWKLPRFDTDRVEVHDGVRLNVDHAHRVLRARHTLEDVFPALVRAEKESA